MIPTFTQLNHGWNAEPNAPGPQAAWQGDSLLLRFRMNAFQFPEYDEDDIGELIFEECTRYRIGTVNDEGWYRDQGRFGRNGHQWGEFYEVSGGLSSDITPDDWVVRCQDGEARRHFLFYFRDEDFECVARGWTLRITKEAQQDAPSDQELSGMTVNERLFACGLLDAWDDAARDRNREQMIALLIETAIPPQQAELTTDAVLKNPGMYDF